MEADTVNSDSQESPDPKPPPDDDKYDFQVIDIEYARERMRGCSESVLVEIAKVLQDEATQRIGEIEAALEAGDAKLLQRAAHTLKGASANFGTKAVVDIAQQIEKDARDQNFETVPKQLETLKERVTAMNAELKVFASQGPG